MIVAGPAQAALSAALLALTDRDQRPPCLETGAADPCAEDEDERAAAALRCAGCPIRDECAALADEERVKFGVWAGRDRTPHDARRKSAS